VPDGFCLVSVGLLEKTLEVVCGRSHRTLVTASGGRDASHAGAARLPVMAIVAAGHRHGPLKPLLAPLIAAFDGILGAVSGDIGQCLPVIARGGLPGSLCWAKHNHFIAGGVLGGDAARLVKCAPEEVAMSTLP
jgi:hypothetical protein